jgi:hypothetical protein
MLRSRLFGKTVLAAVAGLAFSLSLVPGARAEDRRVRHLLAALHELKDVKEELRKDHDYGGHREKALKAVDEAVEQTEKLLKGAGIKIEYTRPKYEGGHPHLRQAVTELKEAKKELKEEWGDRREREKAIKDVDRALDELEECVKHIPK